ncbi:Hypothetical protein HVR_LOCUS115 [uncultured virus]|nr:Hypothetical protein HVR_LOCUS115 [uncultured virus]
MASTGTVNVLANDSALNGINAATLAIIAPPNPFFEGTATVATPNIIYTPAPRFQDTSVFGYSVMDNAGNLGSAAVKVNVDLTFDFTPEVYVVTSGAPTNVIAIDTTTGATVAVAFVLPTNATGGIAANRNDHLMYFAGLSGGTAFIGAFDPITNGSFQLAPTGGVSLTTALGLPAAFTIAGMGYDQQRNLLYAVPGTGSVISQIAPRPYDRYVTPGVQSYTAAALTIGAPIVVATNWFDVTVEPETGYLYATITDAASGLPALVKINPFNSTVIVIVIGGAVLTTLTTPIGIAHGNDGNIYLYGNNGAGAMISNTSTLELTAIPASAIGITDMSDPLFNN